LLLCYSTHFLNSPYPTPETISPACSNTAGTAVADMYLLKTLRIFFKAHINRIILPYFTLFYLFAPIGCIQIFFGTRIYQCYTTRGSFPIDFTFDANHHVTQFQLFFSRVVTPISG